MKTRVVLIVVLFSLAMYLCGDTLIQEQSTTDQVFTHQRSNNRDFITITEEDFEGGIENWEYYDESDPSFWNEGWHQSTVAPYEGLFSWWMGDEELGGYTDHRYVVLDTPTLTLAADNPELNFMFALGCEDTGGDPPYNGWDGANVRISTDGGTTWIPIEGSPAYNGSSFYSFGWEFNEGVGIPGWGSLTEWVAWTPASFDLSAYAGDDVKIRFAFASDPSYNTLDNPRMFGFKVDDIVIDTSTGTFESNGDGAAGDALMVPGYSGTVQGNLWHVYEDTMAPSPVNAVGSFDEATDTYMPGMSNFIVSPEFSLPEEGIFTWDIYVETMLDEGTFPDCDYIHVEVRSQLPGESWLGWTSISNPLYDPDGDNYVFTGSIDTWSLFTDGWGVGYKDISMLAGRNVQFRFGMHSNLEDEVVPGGFRIDNFCVMQEIYQGPAPENLMAVTNEDDQVLLSWDPIIEGGEEGWIQWDDGVNSSAIGYTEGGDIYVAASFDQDDMMPYVGGDITQVEIFINHAPSASTFYVWTGSYGGDEIYSQIFTAPAEAWFTIDLDTPVTIEGGTKYWIGYSATHVAEEFPCGVDVGPAVIGKGEWVASSPGGWMALGLDGNWNIHAYVDGDRVVTNTAPALSRNVTGYNVWYSDVSGENYVNIATVDQSNTPTYLDETPEVGEWNYYVVTAIYDGEDGELSNEAAAYIMSDNALEMIYDDGTAEEGFNVGIAQYMAVKFDPSYANGSCVLTHVRLFVESLNTGQLVMRVYDDSGTGGMPGAQLVQFVVSPEYLTAGWNTLSIPEASLEDVTFNSGSYYVSIFEMANISALGKDTDSVEGQSYITVGGVWGAVWDGNLMIRSYLYYAEGLGTLGDVDSNNVIDAYDASLVLMHAVGMPTPDADPFPENMADVDGNTFVEAFDAALILQYVVGIIDEFPAATRINDIPSAKLDYYFDGEELVITAVGELISASLEFPFKLEDEKLQINDMFISAVWGDKVALASAYPVSGEILRIPVENMEGQQIFTSANSVRGELMISGAVVSCGIRSIYPNPFNPETTIGYNLGVEGTVRIDVYNCKGQKVETLLDARQEAGEHSIVWSAGSSASGIYFVRMNVNGQTEQRKILLIK